MKIKDFKINFSNVDFIRPNIEPNKSEIHFSSGQILIIDDDPDMDAMKIKFQNSKEK